MATTDTTSDLHPSFRNFCDKLVENNYFLRVSKSELYFQLVTRSSGGDSGTTSIWDSWPNSGGKLLLFVNLFRFAVEPSDQGIEFLSPFPSEPRQDPRLPVDCA